MRRTIAIALALTLLSGCDSSDDGPDTASSDTLPPGGTDPAAGGSLVRALDFSPFEDALDALDGARVAELDALTRDGDVGSLRAALADGEATSRELTLFYLSRIRASDPALASVIELAPDALDEADRLDALQASGQALGRLHGLPILLKDNVATGDGLHNTAGAAVLVDHVPPRDSFVAARLREAGALILGKTNLGEWAYFLSSDAPSGRSALGGQVVNPFGAGLEVSGSSTGSAVAAAARFAAATVGTETTGSIIAPASLNGVAGMRPTLGLVSADLIIPVSASLDSAGPIGRNVADLAELLTVMAVRDEADPNAPLAGDAHGTDFTDGLDGRDLAGLRVGVPTFTSPQKGSADEAVLERVTDALEAAGATVVPVTLPEADLRTLGEHWFSLLAGSMAGDLAIYLASADAPIASLADVVAFNEADPDARAPFGQDLLIDARDGALDPDVRDALAKRVREAGQRAIAMAASDTDDAGGPDVLGLDVLMSLDNSFSLVYALAGVPAVTVPAGLDAEGQPHGATFVGLEPGSDASTLAIAHAFERATDLREEPPAR